MDAYCQRQSVIFVLFQLSINNVRFIFDAERLHETQTPKELNMENGDEIDVMFEQVGGSQ
jgi:small ubiquitin-related modifier